MRHELRVQPSPVQLPSRQLDRVQLSDVQASPRHELRVHGTDCHVGEVQLLPVKPLPVQGLLSQLPPLQAVSPLAAVAQADEEKGVPKMSCSPRSSTPSETRRAEPRAASSEPVPLLGVQIWLVEGAFVSRAAFKLIIPAPCALASAPWSGLAVFFSSALT